MDKQAEWAILKSKLQAIADNPAPKGFKYDPNLQRMVKLKPNKPRTFYMGTIAKRPLGRDANGRHLYVGYFRDLTFTHFTKSKGLVTKIWYNQYRTPTNNTNCYHVPPAMRERITLLVDSGKLTDGLAYRTYWCRDMAKNQQNFLYFKLRPDAVVD